MKHTRLSALAFVILLATAPAAFALGGKGSALANQLLQLFFQGGAIPNIAQNASTMPATVLCVSLNTSDPGSGGTLSTNEATYGGYARVSVARTSAGWTVTGNQAFPANTINFPQATGGSETEQFFSIGIPTGGSTCTGALAIMYRGPLSPPIAVTTGVTPQITTGTVITEN